MIGATGIRRILAYTPDGIINRSRETSLSLPADAAAAECIRRGTNEGSPSRPAPDFRSDPTGAVTSKLCIVTRLNSTIREVNLNTGKP